jgi:iron complex transport system permease protein
MGEGGRLKEREWKKGYQEYRGKILKASIVLTFLLIVIFLASLLIGSYGNGFSTIFHNKVVANIRLPRAFSGLIVGAGLAVAGAVMQGLLRNPLASPYTLGVSQAASFGASFAIIVLGAGVASRTGQGVFFTNPYIIPFWAFLGALFDTLIVMGLARLRNLSPEAIILAGVAMGALFHAFTMLLQFFAVNEVLVAASLFWMFGDVGRPYYPEVFIMLAAFLVVALIFMYRRWDYDSILLGDDVAESLGVKVSHVRLEGMMLAALVTSVCVSFTGVIGFIGLISPHIIRIVLGDDYRYLIHLSAATGAIILLLSDIVGRTVISPASIPVGIITSFIGAPSFIYLLLRGGRRR